MEPDDSRREDLRERFNSWRLARRSRAAPASASRCITAAASTGGSPSGALGELPLGEPAWTISTPTHIATSAATRGGSIVCISLSSLLAVRHGLRRGVRPEALLELADDAPQLDRECDLHDAGHERERRDERQQGHRSCPGCANMITPNAIESSPPSTSSSERPPLNGRTNARAISKMPIAIAHAAMA